MNICGNSFSSGTPLFYSGGTYKWPVCAARGLKQADQAVNRAGGVRGLGTGAASGADPRGRRCLRKIN